MQPLLISLTTIPGNKESDLSLIKPKNKLKTKLKTILCTVEQHKHSNTDDTTIQKKSPFFLGSSNIAPLNITSSKIPGSITVFKKNKITCPMLSGTTLCSSNALVFNALDKIRVKEIAQNSPNIPNDTYNKKFLSNFLNFKDLTNFFLSNLINITNIKEYENKSLKVSPIELFPLSNPSNIKNMLNTDCNTVISNKT